jgi:hypothetical protein
MSTEQYTLEKPVWTEADFEQMGWHDIPVHAVAFRPELFELWFDIDYIFNWVSPKGAENYYSFWIAPATLVFENFYELEFDIESQGGEMSLQGIERSDPRTPRNNSEKRTEWRWLLEFNEGQITFRSVGFSQFTRRPPLFVRSQRLTLEQRRGISFEREYSA